VRFDTQNELSLPKILGVRGMSERVGSAGRILILCLAALALGVAGLSVLVSRHRFLTDPLTEAASAYDRGDWDNAARLARARLRTAADDKDALRLLARSSLHQGNETRALSIYKQLDEKVLAAEDFFLLGLEQLRKGHLRVAIETWRRGLKKDPNHFATRAILARNLAMLDRFDEAVSTAEPLLQEPTWRVRAGAILGDLYFQMNDPERAASALQMALDESGKEVQASELERAARLLANCLLRTGRPSQARDVLTLWPAETHDAEFSWLLCRCDLQERRTSSSALWQRSLSYRESRPLVPEPAVYVGAAKCSECHAPNFDSQQHSRHNRTFFRVGQMAELPFPKQPVADPDDPAVTHSYLRRDGHIEHETRVHGQIARTILDYAFGSGDRGLTPVGHDEHDKFFQSRLSFYGSEQGWKVTFGQAGPPGSDDLCRGAPLTRDGVRLCIFCHQTNPTAVLSGKGPEADDLAIGCEKCHGPGGNHLLALEASRKPDDLAIARPTMARGEPIIQLCGQCHARRSVDVALGQPTATEVRFQGTTLPQSRCYRESGGKLDCVTCHNPHRDAETSSEYYEAKCLQCHGAATSARPLPSAGGSGQAFKARTACPVNPMSGCISCHMPKDRDSVPNSIFTDHFIRVRCE
jgi:tetratricopeptide (TPR) repeat protein